MPELLLLLKNNWQYIALAIAVLVVYGYIKVLQVERDHYKTQAAEIQVAYDTAVATAKAKEDALDKRNSETTVLLAAERAKYVNLSVENQANVVARIKSDKELASVKLSVHAVSVFNEPANTTGSKEPAKADTGNASQAPSVGEANDSGFTLADLLAVDKRNEAKYNTCVKQVEDWQFLWNKYSKDVANVHSP